MNKQLLVYQTKILSYIKHETMRKNLERLLTNKTDDAELLISLKDIMNDVIQDNNINYFEEVITYKDYEQLNREYVNMIIKLYNI